VQLQQPVQALPAASGNWPPAPNWPPADAARPSSPAPAQQLAYLETMEASQALRGVRRQRRRRLVAVALVALTLLVGSGLIGLFLLLPGGGSDDEGMVSVISVPEGAAVMFDGKTVSKATPVEIPVPDVKLPHTVEVQLKNYKPFKRNVMFTEGEGRIQVLAVLTPIFGKLDLRSTPPEADIYIDNTHRGRTPATIDNLIPTGDINLELRKRGFRPVTEVIKWEGQTYLTREITLKRASP
jgi:hypothetical protein